MDNSYESPDTVMEQIAKEAKDEFHKLMDKYEVSFEDRRKIYGLANRY